MLKILPNKLFFSKDKQFTHNSSVIQIFKVVEKKVFLRIITQRLGSLHARQAQTSFVKEYKVPRIIGLNHFSRIVIRQLFVKGKKTNQHR
jgi:hypothetical protein